MALLPPDHPGLGVSLAVGEGDRVARGDLLFTDRDEEAVRFVAPAAGVVERIHRGERRRVLAVVVLREGDEVRPAPTGGHLRDRLLAAGLWPAFRTRPYGRIPAPDAAPDALFVTAIDTNPVAAPAARVLEGREEAYEAGLLALTELTEGTVHVATEAEAPHDLARNPRIRFTIFEGPHPAGLPGTHIHHLHPAGRGREVWHVGCQDVLDIGRLATGHAPRFDRVVALGGPSVRTPRLLETVLGASIDDLVAEELEDAPCRVIAGSVLAGRQATGWGAYLGRHHVQITALPEPEAEDDHPVAYGHHTIASRLRRRPRRLTTSLHGRPGPMIPLGTADRVVPLRLLVTPLLRALLAGDVAEAERLGCLELDEEDVALCTFLSPSKIEYGPVLRHVLDEIARGA